MKHFLKPHLLHFAIYKAEAGNWKKLGGARNKSKEGKIKSFQKT